MKPKDNQELSAYRWARNLSMPIFFSFASFVFVDTVIFNRVYGVKGEDMEY